MSAFVHALTRRQDVLMPIRILLRPHPQRQHHNRAASVSILAGGQQKEAQPADGQPLLRQGFPSPAPAAVPCPPAARRPTLPPHPKPTNTHITSLQPTS